MDGRKMRIERIDSLLAVVFISFTSVLMSLRSVWAKRDRATFPFSRLGENVERNLE